MENLKKNFQKKKDPNNYKQLRSCLDYKVKEDSFIFDKAV